MRNRFLVQVLHHYHHRDTAFLFSYGDWASVHEQAPLNHAHVQAICHGVGSYAFRLVCKTQQLNFSYQSISFSHSTGGLYVHS